MSNEKKTNKGFDLGNAGLSQKETATMEAVHPENMQPLRDDEGNKVTITVYGPDSEQRRKLDRKATNRRLKSAKAGRINITAEELEAEAMEVLVACTVSWENIALNGELLECNEKNVRKVYQEFPWLRKQVDNFINEDANFLE